MRRRVAVALLAIAVAACADIAAPVSSLEYVLQSIDGEPLPVVLLTDYDIAVSVVSDVVTLRGDSTFVETVTFRGQSSDGELTAVDSVAGTYSIFNGTLYLLMAGGQASQMRITGDSLIQRFARELVYRRR